MLKHSQFGIFKNVAPNSYQDHLSIQNIKVFSWALNVQIISLNNHNVGSSTTRDRSMVSMVLNCVGFYTKSSDTIKQFNTCENLYFLIHPVVLNNPRDTVKYWNLHFNCDASTTSGLHHLSRSFV